jgi:hypothetical protein
LRDRVLLVSVGCVLDEGRIAERSAERIEARDHLAIAPSDYRV